MFNKVDFSDLYRFLTSIGLLSIAFAFFIPWLYSRNSGFLISTEEYQELTETARQLVDKQLGLNTQIINYTPIASSIFLLIGIAFSIIGIWKWKIKQDAIDETDKINLDNLRLQKLNKEEVEEKAQEELKEEVREVEQTEAESGVGTEKKFKVNFEALSRSLMELEGQFYNKILQYNTFDYEPVANVKIDNHYQADILLRSFDLKKNHDALIEIKYLQKGLSMTIVRNAFEQLKKMYGQYYSKTRRHARLVLIVVYKAQGSKVNQVERFLTAIEDFRKQAGQRDFRLFVMNEMEATEFDVTKLL